MLSIKEINLLQGQNEGLKKQNAELQEEIKKYAAINEQETKDYAELLKENERLKENIEDLSKDLQVQNKILGKFDTTLQEIKAIAEELLEKGLEPQSVEHQLRLRGKRELASIILDLITKAEEE